MAYYLTTSDRVIIGCWQQRNFILTLHRHPKDDNLNDGNGTPVPETARRNSRLAGCTMVFKRPETVGRNNRPRGGHVMLRLSGWVLAAIAAVLFKTAKDLGSEAARRIF